MSEVQRIADQLERSIAGVAWHGPSVLEILADVTADEARRRPLAAAHSIAEIVLHTIAWMTVVEGGLRGATAALDGRADWPPVDADFDWPAALKRLRETSARLGERVKAMPEQELEAIVRGEDREYSRYVLLHGVVQHNLYHAGQLALLKKAVRTGQ